MKALKGGSVVKFTTDNGWGLAIGDAIADGDAFKVRINKMKSIVYLGLLGTTSTEMDKAFQLLSAYCWCMGSVNDIEYFSSRISGKVQVKAAGSVRSGDEILFKRAGGELRVQLADGKKYRMPVPQEETLYVFANVPWGDDEVELLPMSPTEAAGL